MYTKLELFGRFSTNRRRQWTYLNKNYQSWKSWKFGNGRRLWINFKIHFGYFSRGQTVHLEHEKNIFKNLAHSVLHWNLFYRFRVIRNFLFSSRSRNLKNSRLTLLKIFVLDILSRRLDFRQVVIIHHLIAFYDA